MGNKSGASKKISLPPKAPGKLIFLDIDGVLNNASSDVTQLYVMEEDLLILLKRLLDQIPNCGLVLSSTWRYKEVTRAKVIQFFHSANVPAYISCTPNLGTNRVDEILTWLYENTDFCVEGWEAIKTLLPVESRFPEDLPLEAFSINPPLEKVTHFIAIDDMDLKKEKSNFVDFITPRFVHIDKKVGLTEKDVEEAINMLKSDSFKSVPQLRVVGK